MNKIFAILFAIFIINTGAYSQVVINEILYTVPGTGENEEFVEIHNSGSSPVNLEGYNFTMAFTYTFGNVSIAANGYMVIARDSSAFNSAFSMTADGDFAGTLGNSESIVLKDSTGTTIDSVFFDDAAPWPVLNATNNTEGRSVQLCNATSDNNDGSNWGVNNTQTGINGTSGTDSLYATPGAINECITISPPSFPFYTLGQVNTVDTDGIPDSLGVLCELRGITHCTNLKSGNGFDFIFANSDNSAGIRVFSFNDVDNYTVTEGDSLHIEGTIAQYNGLLQFSPNSISVISQANATANPMVVSTPDESTENRHISLIGVYLVDTSAWTTGSGTGGFNVLVTSGTDTSLVRIDAQTDLFNQSAPLGTFDLTGWGSQFDSNSPYDEGYQIMPCAMSNIVTGNINRVNNSDHLSIFPNPTSGILNIRSTDNIENIRVHNTLGQEVLQVNNINSSNTQLSTNNLENGIYIISVVSGQKIMTQQFQVMK